MRQPEVIREQRNLTPNAEPESKRFGYPGGIAVCTFTDRYEDIQPSDRKPFQEGGGPGTVQGYGSVLLHFV